MIILKPNVHFEGKPCVKCNGTIRYLRDSACVSCKNSKKRTLAYREQHKAHALELRHKHPEIVLLEHAKARAKRENLACNITIKDILDVWPKDNLCPFYKTPLIKAYKVVKNTSPTLDRIFPSKGYVRGNIQVMSFAANAMKRDCTDPAPFYRMGDYLVEINKK